MTRVLLWGILVAAAPVTYLTVSDRSPVGDDLVRRARPAGIPLPLEAQHYSAWGTVTDVTNKAITIRDEESHLPRRFVTSPRLAAGGAWGTGSRSYRLADVRVGDRVAISYSKIPGIDTCFQFAILRRPGGRVPPAPDEPPDQLFKWHEGVNACQEREEVLVDVVNRHLTPFADAWAATSFRVRAAQEANRPVAPLPRAKP